jgi:hypothetical protein
MRLFLFAAAAILLLADRSAPAHARCVDPFDFEADGIKKVAAHTPAGQPCRIVLGRSANIDAVEIAVPPERGAPGVSEKIENRRCITCVPRAGSAGTTGSKSISGIRASFVPIPPGSIST